MSSLSYLIDNRPSLKWLSKCSLPCYASWEIQNDDWIEKYDTPYFDMEISKNLLEYVHIEIMKELSKSFKIVFYWKFKKLKI